jgi:hypothetical protein
MDGWAGPGPRHYRFNEAGAYIQWSWNEIWPPDEIWQLDPQSSRQETVFASRLFSLCLSGILRHSHNQSLWRMSPFCVGAGPPLPSGSSFSRFISSPNPSFSRAVSSVSRGCSYNQNLQLFRARTSLFFATSRIIFPELGSSCSRVTSPRPSVCLSSVCLSSVCLSVYLFCGRLFRKHTSYYVLYVVPCTGTDRYWYRLP